MASFDDLVFNLHPVFGFPSVRAEIQFPNGYGASIIGGDGAYGDGVRTFELAVLHHGDLCYSSPITDDVLGHQTHEEITSLLQRIETLPEAK